MRSTGRWKKYTSAKQLTKAVESYFYSISRTELVKEPVGTGRLDRYGHEILEMVPVYNDDGKEIRRRVYHVPPTRGGLCAHLGISRDTWQRYCDRGQNPQFAEITEWAEDQLRTWRDDQLHERDDKHIKGLLHDLTVNYAAGEKKQVEVSVGPGRELRELTDAQLRAMLDREDDRGGQ